MRSDCGASGLHADANKHADADANKYADASADKYAGTNGDREAQADRDESSDCGSSCILLANCVSFGKRDGGSFSDCYDRQ